MREHLKVKRSQLENDTVATELMTFQLILIINTIKFIQHQPADNEKGFSIF